MPPSTSELWGEQHRLVGDRLELFSAVASAVASTSPVRRVLYPGSCVDITP